MKASKLDKKFDDNQEDILEYFDISKIKMINEEPKRVNIDFPAKASKFSITLNIILIKYYYIYN